MPHAIDMVCTFLGGTPRKKNQKPYPRTQISNAQLFLFFHRGRLTTQLVGLAKARQMLQDMGIDPTRRSTQGHPGTARIETNTNTARLSSNQQHVQTEGNDEYQFCNQPWDVSEWNSSISAQNLIKRLCIYILDPKW